METKPVSKAVENHHEEWFSTFITTINKQIATDKNNLEHGNASKETVAFYKSLVDNDNLTTFSLTRNASSNALIRIIVLEYLKLITEHKISLLNLALDISSNKILVWTEIKENDEATEMALIKTESIINGLFADKTGIYLDSIIVEDCDNLEVPPHYSLVVIN